MSLFEATFLSVRKKEKYFVDSVKISKSQWCSLKNGTFTTLAIVRVIILIIPSLYRNSKLNYTFLLKIRENLLQNKNESLIN